MRPNRLGRRRTAWLVTNDPAQSKMPLRLDFDASQRVVTLQEGGTVEFVDLYRAIRDWEASATGMAYPSILEASGSVELPSGTRTPRVMVFVNGWQLAAVIPVTIANGCLAGKDEHGGPLHPVTAESRSKIHLPQEERAPASKVVIGLHGIRTRARWQKALAEVAQRNSLVPRIHRWDFGWFSVFRFLIPRARENKLRWFRETYDTEVKDRDVPLEDGAPPSIVAHSFGTYLVGHALKRFKHLRLDRVLLCGSILPTDFDWQLLIDRKQVGRLRVEYGVRDPWVRLAGWLIGGAGPSGARGFTIDSPDVEQEEFEYDHGEYFSQGHMEGHWVPFLQGQNSVGEAPAPKPGPKRPWLAFALVPVLAVSLVATALGLRWSAVSEPESDEPVARQVVETPGEPIDIVDDFVQANYDLHTLFDREFAEVEHGPDGLKVTARARGVLPFLYGSRQQAGDFRAVLDFALLTPGGKGSAGLIFRSDPDTGDDTLTSYHLVGLNVGGGELWVRTFKDGEWPDNFNFRKPLEAGVLQTDGVQKLRVDAVGKRARVFVNNRHIDYFDLGPGLDSGMIGIYVSSLEPEGFALQFRRLTVSAEG